MQNLTLEEAHALVAPQERKFRPLNSIRKENITKAHLHQWVRYNKVKTGICTQCGEHSYNTQWANFFGEYKRDLDDFIEMCSMCHREWDMIVRSIMFPDVAPNGAPTTI